MHKVVTGVSLESPIEPNTLHFVGDDELLFRTRELARHETELTIVTIQHLDEIERRGLYDKRGYPSLFEYAVRELHYSKGCAWRRIMVMKLCRAVPGIADKVRSGELNLTTASQLQNAIEKRARKAARERAGAASAGAEESESGEVHPARAGVAGAASGAVCAPVGAAAAQAAVGESPAGESAAVGESAAAVPLPAGPAATGVTAEAGTAGVAPAAAVSAEPGAFPDETEAARVAEKAAFAAPAAAAAAPTAGAARESAALPPVADPPTAWTLDQKVELVDLVANKSARETEKLLAALEPEVGLPRERQRALGGGRYEVRMILDQGSVDTIAKLKGWLSHVNPGFTTGQLLAYLLQQAERKYDPVRERGRRKRGAAAPAGHAETCEQHLGVSNELPATESALGAVGSKAGSSTCATGAPGEGVPATGAARRSVAAGSVAAGAPAPGSAAAGSADAGFAAPGPAAADPSVALAAGSAQNQRAGTVPNRSGERTPYHAAGSADAGFPAPASSAAGPSGALAAGSAQNRGAQRVPAPGSEQDRRDTAGSAQNQPPPRAGNVRSRTDTEPHRGVRARLPGDGTAAPPPVPESARACRARRHIPAAVRRAVWRRCGGACCYQDPLTGVSCGSTHLVQIDHIVPLAQGGSDDISNLRLRCAVHNRRRDPRCASYRSAPAGARGRSRSISNRNHSAARPALTIRGRPNAP